MKLPLIAVEIVLGFGVPRVWGFWELWSLRREKERDRARPAPGRPEQAEISVGGDAEGFLGQGSMAAAASETAASPEPKLS